MNLELPLTKHTAGGGTIETTILIDSRWWKHIRSKNQDTMFKYLDLLDRRVKEYHRKAIRICYNHIEDTINSYETR